MNENFLNFMGARPPHNPENGFSTLPLQFCTMFGVAKILSSQPLF